MVLEKGEELRVRLGCVLRANRGWGMGDPRSRLAGLTSQIWADFRYIARPGHPQGIDSDFPDSPIPSAVPDLG
jgi:hypothetical protein